MILFSEISLLPHETREIKHLVVYGLTKTTPIETLTNFEESSHQRVPICKLSRDRSCKQNYFRIFKANCLLASLEIRYNKRVNIGNKYSAAVVILGSSRGQHCALTEQMVYEETELGRVYIAGLLGRCRWLQVRRS